MQMFTTNRIRKKCKQNFFLQVFFPFFFRSLPYKEVSLVWLKKKHKIAEAKSPKDEYCQVRSCRFLT